MSVSHAPQLLRTPPEVAMLSRDGLSIMLRLVRAPGIRRP
jgi:hypothetical protein